jgi:hypothetical protein
MQVPQYARMHVSTQSLSLSGKNLGIRGTRQSRVQSVHCREQHVGDVTRRRVLLIL